MPARRRVSVGGLSVLALLVSLAPAAQAAAPTPSPSASPPCAAPQARYFGFTPKTLAAGDLVHVTGSIKDACVSSQPSETFTVYAQRAQDAAPVAVARTTSDSNGQFAVDLVVNETETLSVKRDATNDELSYPDPQAGPPVVQVDRVSGSCAGVVALTAPPVVHLGDSVLLTGQRSDTSTVTIKARQRARTTFTSLATAGPDANGRFTARYQANDDYAVYAAGQRCDSPATVVQIKPTISGPVTVRRGTSVPLSVTGLPTAPVAVYFHKAGSTGYVKRRLSSLGKTGVYTTTYVADADYRYYAVVGNDHRVSNFGLTQVR